MLLTESHAGKVRTVLVAADPGAFSAASRLISGLSGLQRSSSEAAVCTHIWQICWLELTHAQYGTNQHLLEKIQTA